MNDKPRKQLSLRFDNYSELYDEAKKYCEINNITLVDLVATGLRLAMTSQQPSQSTRHDKAIENDSRLVSIDDRLAKLEEQLAMTSQVNAMPAAGVAIAPDRELIRDEIAERTAYLATAMNEVKSQLENQIEFLKTRVENLEQNQEEKLTYIPVTAETTIQDVVLPLPQEQEEDAIAAETTENHTSAQAGKKLSAKELKSKSNSIATTLNGEGFEISRDIIKAKILELYPNSDDWLSKDAREDVMRALRKQHRKG